LMTSATLVAVAQRLVSLVRRVGPVPLWGAYGRGLAMLTVLAALALGGGWTIQEPELDYFRVKVYGVTQFKFNDLRAPSQFVRDQPGDVVLANNATVTNHYLESLRTDFWLESTLQLPASLDDTGAVLVDRRDGRTPMVPNLASLEDIFARHDRIWFIGSPNTN